MNERSKKRKLKAWWRQKPPCLVESGRSGDIACGDAVACLNSIQDEIADVVFLDPPFNLGKRYGARAKKHDRLASDEYCHFLEKVITEAFRILAPGGSIFVYHIPRRAIQLSVLLERNLLFQHWIAISMKNGFVRGPRLYPAHYALLHYTKGPAAIINRPKVLPAKCPHCGDLIRDYGGYREHVEQGVNLSDVWDDLSPVRHPRYKHREANELPILIVHRALQISGRRGGLVVDPFAGTGTTAVAARIQRMKYIVSDIQSDCCQLVQQRLMDLAASASEQAKKRRLHS
jgi:site-specific DNA-methyltransferase (adenine-specific)